MGRYSWGGRCEQRCKVEVGALKVRCYSRPLEGGPRQGGKSRQYQAAGTNENQSREEALGSGGDWGLVGRKDRVLRGWEPERQWTQELTGTCSSFITWHWKALPCSGPQYPYLFNEHAGLMLCEGHRAISSQ